MPSLQATFIRHRLTSGLRERGLKTPPLPSNLVYQFPTIVLLAKALHRLVTDNDLGPAESKDSTAKMLEETAMSWSSRVLTHRGKADRPDGIVAVITVRTSAKLGY